MSTLILRDTYLTALVKELHKSKTIEHLNIQSGNTMLFPPDNAYSIDTLRFKGIIKKMMPCTEYADSDISTYGFLIEVHDTLTVIASNGNMLGIHNTNNMNKTPLWTWRCSKRDMDIIMNLSNVSNRKLTLFNSGASSIMQEDVWELQCQPYHTRTMENWQYIVYNNPAFNCRIHAPSLARMLKGTGKVISFHDDSPSPLCTQYKVLEPDTVSHAFMDVSTFNFPIESLDPEIIKRINCTDISGTVPEKAFMDTKLFISGLKLFSGNVILSIYDTPSSCKVQLSGENTMAIIKGIAR